MTTIIKEVYDKPDICKTFKRRAWVKLVHPFSPHEFIRTLLFQFHSNCCPQVSTVDVLKPMEVIEVTERGLIKEFKKQVNSERYLVILEDMSTMDDWDTIRAYLSDNNNGSCVIVQTQQLEIASFCIGHPHRVSELKRFSDDHSVCVFLKEDRGKDVPLAKEKAALDWLAKFEKVRVGREIDLSVLQRAVHAANEDMIVVWGIAGVGKSSIVRHVYYSEVCERIKYKGLTTEPAFERCGWVNVSHPLDITDLSRNLLLDLQFECLQQYSMLRIKDPTQECRDLLHEHRCLVVIHGLQSTEEWDLIKSALVLGATESHPRSRVIVITNEASVAAYCAASTTWNVKGLEVDESLDLFTKKVSEKTDSSNLRTEVIEHAEHILHKCGGFPKVIVAVADFLSSQLKENRVDIESWWMRNHRFMHELVTNRAFGALQGLFSWVHSYFRTCPDFLKPCIFYLSIFPINHEIRRRRLVRRWMAEGYARDNKQSTAEETAEEFISKLVDLCMIRMLGSAILASSFRMSLCQINGFFREYIISRPMEENLVFSLEGHCSMNSQRTGRHLTIADTWDRERIVFESIDFTRLRSLTVFGEWRSFFISDEMRLLRVLDLENATGVTDGDLEKMVNLLPGLKFLSLRGCREVTRLPDLLDNLRQLQTLDIIGTFIIKLPKSIVKLQKLQFIRAGTTDDDEDTCTTAAESASVPAPSMNRQHGTLVPCFSQLCIRRRLAGSQTGCVEVPRGIRRLTALHTLGVINISVARWEAVLKELKNLTLLRRLGVSGINLNNSHDFFSAISGHNILELLVLYLDNDNEGCLDGISQPPKNISSLKLYGLVDKIPVWIKELQNLTRLHLQMNMLPQEGIDLLGSLPKLAILSLSFNEFQHGELRFHSDLKLVHVLEISCNSRLEAVRFPTLGFSNLVALKLHCSDVSSQLQVFGLCYHHNLKEVWLSGSPGQAFKQHLRSQLAEHPNEIKPVLREGPRW